MGYDATGGPSPAVIGADALLLLLAGIAFLGFVLDALFERIRISSILPLMLIGVLLVALGFVDPSDVHELDLAIPYVSALTVAFILFSVGLEIRFAELYRVIGRATAYTLLVQSATGVAIALVAFVTIHWSLLVCFVFGFGLSGPSSISVPRLLNVVRVPDALKTSMLYESVVSDVLQLLVPITLVGILVSGSTSVTAVSESLLWTTVGSVGVGLAAGLFWLIVLDRLKRYTQGYTWTLSITMVLATYGFADVIGMSAAITIFVFGVLLGNALLFDAARPATSPLRAAPVRAWLSRARKRLRVSAGGLDVAHIQGVQNEVSFFASSFFFVFIGLLFEASGLNATLVAVPLVAAALMLLLRLVATPLLRPYLSTDAHGQAAERILLTFNISRGLAAAVVATLPLAAGIVIPGFLDAMFLGILFSTLLSTVGIFLLYRPSPPGPGFGVPPAPVGVLAAVTPRPPTRPPLPKKPADP